MPAAPAVAVAARMARVGVLPGFRVTLALTLGYLAFMVALPILGLVLTLRGTPLADLIAAVTSDRALAAFKLSFGGAAVAAVVNVGLGLLLAWILVRYSFPGRGLVDALIDLPLALPTAVAGIALTAIHAPTGTLGQVFERFDIKIAFAAPGVILAMIFVGLPFVVRTVEPVLMEVDASAEEAAAVLGASRWFTFRHVILRALGPALVTGFGLAFARAVGEYGSIVFISGNLPLETEIVPLLIVSRLEQYQYGHATALALVMLAGSLGSLLLLNILHARARKRGHHG